MAKALDKNILIVVILVTCLVSSVLSVGITTFLSNTPNTLPGEKGDKGDTGATGPKGDTGQTGETGSTGTTGTSGSDGQNGRDGGTLYSGQGPPAATLGINGDTYLDTATNDLYQRVSGVWVKKTNLQLNNKAEYNSGWVDIRSLAGKNLTLTHGLNSTNLQVQIEGMDSSGNIHQKYLGLDSSVILGWNQSYGELTSIATLGMTNTSDGGFILTGAIIKSLYLESSDLFLLKLDSSGYVMWYKVYDFDFSDVGYSVVETSDGGYAVTGIIYSITSDRNVFILKTDVDGVQDWLQIYQDHSAYVTKLIQTSDLGYALVGETYNETDYQIYIAKTDAAGVMQWNKSYVGEGGQGILQTSDGGFLALAQFLNYTNYHPQIYLLKVDGAGVMQWNHTYGSEDESRYGYSLISTSDGGYAVAGYSHQESTYNAEVNLIKTSIDGTLQWNYSYPSSFDEYGYAVVEASAGGYVIAGYRYTISGAEMLLMKTSNSGAFEWNQTYSNTGYDRALAVAETTSGGYALVGYGFYGNDEYIQTFFVSTTSSGAMDISQVFGGPNRDYGYSVVATSDGGYAIAGYTIDSLAGFQSVYLIKTTADGALNWTHTYPISDSSRAYSVIQTSDGGYAIAGVSQDDMLLLKTYPNGTLQWSRTYDLSGNGDYGYSVRQTSDGGYAVAGYAYVESGSTSSADVFLVKTNANGIMQWNKTYGGLDDELGYSLVVTSDGGYAIAGIYSSSMVYEVDTMLIKTAQNGNLQWMKIYNSTNDDYGYSVVATSDGGYAIAGYMYSSLTDSSDMYVIKIGSDGTAQWNQTYGTQDDEYCYQIINAPDGGYVLCGYSRSNTIYSYTAMLTKISLQGTMEWINKIAGSGYERGRSVAATPDGGYVVAGYGSNSNSMYDVHLIKPSITVEQGLARVSTTANTITVYRGLDDSYWQYVRIQIWQAD